MKSPKHVLAALSLSVVLLAAGCSSNNNNQSANNGGTPSASGQPETSTSASTEKLQIKTSFYPMYEFTRHVAGDLADVESLIPPDVEPHDWEPTAKDLAEITDADVLIYNGAGLEGWVDQVTSSATGGNLTTIEASKGLDIMDGFVEEEEEEGHDEGQEEEHDHGGLDPHVWLSPALAIKEVGNIEQGLAQVDPNHADTYKANADAYVAQLQQLDQDFKDGLKDVKRKDFITQHAAFGYLAKEYGLTQVPIAGLSPEQEPSAAKMAEIVDFAKEHNVKTIFFETLVSSSVADTISKEIGAKSAVLNPIEGLTAEDQANGLDYIGIMRQNLEALKTALNE
ncbi:metal ABC transporter substrate-binding protein [Paenibacillus physcomitrellae]|uniref:High-affinity zinc uptake system binding-protein ZnuA n=1 Tax=Paenibacillus physcomitrellae TaxID=1619311 RepID=A0ABQ1FS64_9BACL|nr:metal ABC transporter substrate-binding protein [Paenibacillus physcomitrellae]GGA25573.1 high-affinity zinc uptake system binding-protein ZnuA [Paenibacillus physcomitrellae]